MVVALSSSCASCGCGTKYPRFRNGVYTSAPASWQCCGVRRSLPSRWCRSIKSSDDYGGDRSARASSFMMKFILPEVRGLPIAMGIAVLCPGSRRQRSSGASQLRLAWQIAFPATILVRDDTTMPRCKITVRSLAQIARTRRQRASCDRPQSIPRRHLLQVARTGQRCRPTNLRRAKIRERRRCPRPKQSPVSRGLVRQLRCRQRDFRPKRGSNLQPLQQGQPTGQHRTIRALLPPARYHESWTMI